MFASAGQLALVISASAVTFTVGTVADSFTVVEPFNDGGTVVAVDSFNRGDVREDFKRVVLTEPG